MRIVGGIWRGRAIEAPQGRGTRPTTDRMRETIASMVLSAEGLDLDGLAVLDAFAGSGGVGLELLSRGAAHATFCERDNRAASLIVRNCRSLGADASAYRVVRGDVCRLAADGRVGGPFDIVFLDPPYKMAAAEVDALVEELFEHGSLAQACLVVYERASEADGLSGAHLVLERSRTHGTTAVDLYRTTVDEERT